MKTPQKPDTSTIQQTPPQKDTAVTAGKGMPATQPLPGRAPDGHTRTQHDVSVEASLRMPSERDQSIDMTADAPDAVVVQARQDIKRGIEDTSKGPEMNQAYKKLK